VQRIECTLHHLAPHIDDPYEMAIASIDEAIRNVVSVGAHPDRIAILDNFGVIPAIEWQLSDFQKRTGIRATLKCQGDRAIDRETSTVVFRIIQEALTNVIRHAQATKVNVKVKVDRRSLTLQVTDNGRGISKVEISGFASLGILGMHERVTRLGGEFKIGPRLPAGTQLDVFIPLGEESPAAD